MSIDINERTLPLLAAAYREGVPLRRLAAVAGVSYVRVRATLVGAGVALRRPGAASVEVPVPDYLLAALAEQSSRDLTKGGAPCTRSD